MIALFELNSGAPLATMVFIVIEVPVILSVICVVLSAGDSSAHDSANLGEGNHNARASGDALSSAQPPPRALNKRIMSADKAASL